MNGQRISIRAPMSESEARRLKAGDQVLLSGVIWSARDAAHRRMMLALDAGDPLPIPLRDQVIYFVGPCPAPPGRVIGSAGPTTSGRMDAYSPRLMRIAGLRAMIGKGARGREVVSALRECGGVYFAAVGGAGALIARSIVAAEVVAYADLGAEAIYRLEVKELPLVVAIDALGGNLYERAGTS